MYPGMLTLGWSNNLFSGKLLLYAGLKSFLEVKFWGCLYKLIARGRTDYKCMRPGFFVGIVIAVRKYEGVWGTGKICDLCGGKRNNKSGYSN